MKGQCLCGQVRFELDEPLPDLYQCHCSLCRKVSGSSANAAMIVAAPKFRWLSGQELMSRFVHDNGFKSDFCSRCGSPLPNPSANNNVWVPVGLLDDSDQIKVVAQMHVASKADWDQINGGGEHFDEMPDTETFQRLFIRQD